MRIITQLPYALLGCQALIHVPCLEFVSSAALSATVCAGCGEHLTCSMVQVWRKAYDQIALAVVAFQSIMVGLMLLKGAFWQVLLHSDRPCQLVKRCCRCRCVDNGHVSWHRGRTDAGGTAAVQAGARLHLRAFQILLTLPWCPDRVGKKHSTGSVCPASSHAGPAGCASALCQHRGLDHLQRHVPTRSEGAEPAGCCGPGLARPGTGRIWSPDAEFDVMCDCARLLLHACRPFTHLHCRSSRGLAVKCLAWGHSTTCRLSLMLTMTSEMLCVPHERIAERAAAISTYAWSRVCRRKATHLQPRGPSTLSPSSLFTNVASSS